MSTTYTDEQQMLMLALASYQGFWMPHLLEASGEPLRNLLQRALASFEALGVHWKVAWGPATLCSSGGLLDDVLAFVARDDSTPPRYAVVIRGTNPLSLSDWIFGDCWVLRDRAWDYGAHRADERISCSSSLGLAVVQSLRSVPVADHHAPARISVSAGLHGLGALLEHSEKLLKDRVSGLFHDARAEFASALRGDLAALDLTHFNLLVDDARAQGKGHDGVDLATFLGDVMQGATAPTQVWVTGHSKGGALATAVALWLADTRETWDPGAQAQVHCTTFAGPTVGNGAFAERVTRVLGDRHRRVANRRDLVTQGWAFETVDRATWVDGQEAPGWFQALARGVAGTVRSLKYTQVEAHAHHFDGGIPPRFGGLAGEMTYQHLYAYIADAQLSPGMFGLPEFPLAPFG